MVLIRLCSLALLSLLIVVSTVHAQVVDSSVTISTAKGVPTVPAGSYDISVSGKATLGTNDVFIGVSHKYIDPNSQNVTPFLNWITPGQGKTTDWYSYLKGTKQAGTWTAVIEMQFKDKGGFSGTVSSPKTFSF